MPPLFAKFDQKKLIYLLLIVIGVMLLIWKPWQTQTPARSAKVTGEGTITAAPDEFGFQALYQTSGSNSRKAIAKVSQIGNPIVDKLKKLGVEESGIETTVNTGAGYVYPDQPGVEPQTQVPNQNTASFSINLKVHDKNLAQKVLDYLTTTPLSSGPSPSSTFRQETRVKLELEARQKALQNARLKAEQTTKELGVRLGKVLSVSDLEQFGGPIILKDSAVSSEPQTQSTNPKLEIGSQDLQFSIIVEYQFR